MLGFQSLILNLFTWLTFLVPQDYVAPTELQVYTPEEVITSGNQQSAAIIESNRYLHQWLDTSQNLKLLFPSVFAFIQLSKTDSNEPKLLYYSIGNAIDLELTSTVIIFPFHCFT